MCPESGWIRTEQPELRIVSQPLWEQGQARRKAQANGPVHSGQVGSGPKCLLSGLLKCGLCESSFVIADAHCYGFDGHLSRGCFVCANSLRVSRTLAEEK
jgi:hypothetical protein